MANFKTLVKTAITALLTVNPKESGKDQAVRRFGVASEIVKLGEADKKKAKAELEALGLTTKEAGIVFDSPLYLMTATVRAASSRLDAGKLDIAMAQEQLSLAMRRRIIAASTVENAAAVSYVVEQK